MANPPFNIKDWARDVDDPRWKYGAPPAGNANYAWLQHILSKLAPRRHGRRRPGQRLDVVQAVGEGEIRAAMVEADLVACMVALPAQLFRTHGDPGVPVVPGQGQDAAGREGAGPTGAARCCSSTPATMGYMVDRTERVLTDEDIAKIADTYHAWRGTQVGEGRRADVRGRARLLLSATLAEIKAARLRADAGPVCRRRRGRGRRTRSRSRRRSSG